MGNKSSLLNYWEDTIQFTIDFFPALADTKLVDTATHAERLTILLAQRHYITTRKRFKGPNMIYAAFEPTWY